MVIYERDENITLEQALFFSKMLFKNKMQDLASQESSCEVGKHCVKTLEKLLSSTTIFFLHLSKEKQQLDLLIQARLHSQFLSIFIWKSA